MQKNNLLRSAGFRYTLVYTALFVISTIVLLGTLYTYEIQFIRRDADARIDGRVAGLVSEYKRGGVELVRDDIEARLRSQVGRHSIYRLTDNKGKIIVGNLPMIHLPMGRTELRISDEDSSRDATTPLRIRTVRLNDEAILSVGVELAQLDWIGQLLRRAAFGMFAGSLLLGGLVGATMTRRLLSRIEGINATVNDIMNGRFDRRVKTSGTSDELDQLAMGMNAMLDRIVDLMANLRDVANNIAHDLRTPLSRLGRRLEEAQNESTSDTLGALAIEAAIGECNDIIDTFNSILSITQIENISPDAIFSDVSLAEVLTTIEDNYAPLLEDEMRPFSLSIGEDIIIRGERAMLLQLLANLVENAMKHTPPGTPVHLALERHQGRARLCVEDRGPGIPPHAHDKVFERFYRLQTSRSTMGSGLGMSFVAAIAKLHKAEIQLEDANPGLRVVVDFPI